MARLTAAKKGTYLELGIRPTFKLGTTDIR